MNLRLYPSVRRVYGSSSGGEVFGFGGGGARGWDECRFMWEDGKFPSDIGAGEA